MSPAIHQHTLPFGGNAFSIFYIFKDRPQAFFLDSSLHRSQAKFSYIGFDPFTTVRGRDWVGFKRVFDKYRLGAAQRLFFPAGAVGYLGYDGSLFFGFYDTILSVDHQKHRLIISSFSKARIKDILKCVSSGGRGRGLPSERRLLRATASVRYEDRARWGNPRTGPEDQPKIHFKSNFTKADYMKAVRQALEHIRRGDIYQINLSHQVKVQAPLGPDGIEPATIYGNLRRSFPSEFGAYFDDGRQVILSASPERFLKLQKGIALLKPMKGTRPRGKTRARDKILKEQLQKSPKEIAELLMVTDMERNDLGRVCDYSSVKVKVMRTIETYASVFQATSTVEGRLRRGCDQFDLLQATFPSGSVTGCPKIEAMKIIEKLERGPRGLYTGALGYMSFSGSMDFNVMIRTMFLNPKQITFHVGGGIVADSRPQDEWQETWDKARPLIETLKRSFL
jgi:para-aminobenzoate synthetase component 1